MAQKDPYDCKNRGDILQFTLGGLSVSYCSCLDLKADGMDGYYSGPQCAYEIFVKEVEMPSAQITPVLPESSNNMANTMSPPTDYEAHQIITAQVAKVAYENDKSCGDGCNDAGICRSSVCYCDKYHSGDKCEKDLAHPGVKAPIGFVFYGIALLLGLVTGGFVAKIYNDNGKHLFL